LYKVISKIGDSPLEKLPQGDRPLSGIRVLDLTRAPAGPTLRPHPGRARCRRLEDHCVAHRRVMSRNTIPATSNCRRGSICASRKT
jgi:hypothetical protein